MAVRSSMAALIARVRILIYDPVGVNQIFADQDIQDVMDESRLNVVNGSTSARPTFSGSSVQYLDYYTSFGGWEDDLVLKQYLTTVLTPATSEPIAGHWTFSLTTLPPIYITGKQYDVYRAAADLLERMSARWALSYNISMDGQNLQRSQAAPALQNLAKTYRLKQRPTTISMTRSDLARNAAQNISLAATDIDYIGSGDGR